MATHHYTAQVILQGKTGLAEDRFVNTWHFQGGDGGGDGSGMLGVAARLSTFYTKTYAGNPLSHFLSPVIQPVATINVYDADSPKPRQPFPFHFTLGAPGGITAVPEQIALCMSYFSVRNLPRQRGRVYLGPFNTTVLTSSETVTSRPTGDLLNTIKGAATELMIVDDGITDYTTSLLDGLLLSGLSSADLIPPFVSRLVPKVDFPTRQLVTWQQYSPVGGGTQPTKKHPEIPVAREPAYGFVTAGWTDNEWDGQSRRRVSASARVTFP
jgi:hypothetical protein